LNGVRAIVISDEGNDIDTMLTYVGNKDIILVAVRMLDWLMLRITNRTIDMY